MRVRSQTSSPPHVSPPHVILFLATNPTGNNLLGLEEECAAIERELSMTEGRRDFDFRSKWAVTTDDMMRHLNELRPSVIHFSGPGHGSVGHTRGLRKMIETAAASTRVVVLNACYTSANADELRSVVDCVVGMTEAIDAAAARSFVVSFYRALGHRRSVGNAVEQARAVLEAREIPGEQLPRCTTREGLDAAQIFLGESTAPAPDRASCQARSPRVMRARYRHRNRRRRP